MNKVAVVGYGNTKFSNEDKSIESLLTSATKSLFDQTKNIEQDDIDAVLVSTNDNTKYLSAILSELTGISPKIAHTVENLCSSGTNSIVSAYSYIVSGLADIALVVGADRYDCPGQILEWDVSRGEFKHPVFWASVFTKSPNEVISSGLYSGSKSRTCVFIKRRSSKKSLFGAKIVSEVEPSDPFSPRSCIL